MLGVAESARGVTLVLHSAKHALFLWRETTMKLVLICGPWGSGTSAVAGAVVRIGCHAPGPFFQSNDPRTPNTYECIPFIETVRKVVSCTTFEISVSSREAIVEELGTFRDNYLRAACRHRGVSEDGPILLKYPLSAVIIGEITRAFDTRLIIVLRPLDRIEDSRKRRNWPPILGEAGAKLVYTHIFNHIVMRDTPAMVVNYGQMLKHPQYCLEEMERFIYSGRISARLDDALSFISAPSSRRLDEV